MELAQDVEHLGRPYHPVVRSAGVIWILLNPVAFFEVNQEGGAAGVLEGKRCRHLLKLGALRLIQESFSGGVHISNTSRIGGPASCVWHGFWVRI